MDRIIGIICFLGLFFFIACSSTQTATTTTTTIVSGPIDFDGVTSAIANGPDKITVSWTALMPESSYFYQVNLSTESQGQDFDNPVVATAFGDSSYQVTSLEAGTTYYIIVRAMPATGSVVETNTTEAVATTEANPDWNIKHVDDSSDDVGLYSVVKVDSDDNWNIFYSNITDSQIWLSGPATGSPYYETGPLPKPDLTYRPFVDVGSGDHFELVYYDISNDQFVFCKQSVKDIGVSGSYCDSAIEGGEKGRFASIKINAGGSREVAYYDSSAKDLKYAQLTSAAVASVIDIVTIETTGDVGSYCSLALDAFSEGLPRISYYDATNGNLKYATKGTDESWSTDIVDATNDVGQHSSLAINSLGIAYVAYYDATNKDLKVAINSGSGWEDEIIDVTGEVGSCCALALDSSGNPGISYYDATNGNLKYAYKSSGTWATQTVAANDNVGQHASLDFTSQDKAAISYYDATRGDLWIAIEK